VRLVYVVDHFPRLSERFVVTELLELRRRGERVVIVARCQARDLEEDVAGLSVLRLPRRGFLRDAIRSIVSSPGRSLPALGWAIRASRRERGALRTFGQAAFLARRLPAPDLFHAHFAHGSATHALLVSRLTGRPFSFTAHARDLLVATHPSMLRRKAAEAAAVVAVSEFTAARFRAVAGTHREKVVVVRNGVDTGAIRRAIESSPRRRDPLVLAVARLVEKKGLDTLVRACGTLRDRGLEVRCEIIGEGPERPALESLVRTLGVQCSVSLVGAQPHEEVLRRLGRGRVFALPCRQARDGDEDALPVALVEALASGLPAVSTTAGGIAELIADGTSGRLVAPGDSEGLANALAQLLEDDDLWARLAAGGRKAAAPYDVVRCVDALQAVFSRAVG
jgi:glycosyltransferase involved in cell wall biosynthesis